MAERLAYSEANSRRIAIVEQCFGAAGQPLVKSGRVLVGEGVLTKMCRKRPKPRQFFLFNDILVYGNIVLDKRKFNKQHIVALEDVKLQSLENDGAWKNGWQIISPKKSFAVFAANPTEKAEWMAHINKCISDLLARSNKRPATEHAAVWVPDSEAQTCMHCLKTKFTPINRRHHCRKCGTVVCGTCSNRKFVLPYQSDKPVRVCITCYETLASSTTATSMDKGGHLDSKEFNRDYEVPVPVASAGIGGGMRGFDDSDERSLDDLTEQPGSKSEGMAVPPPQPRYGSSDDDDGDDEDNIPETYESQPQFYDTSSAENLS